MESIVPKHGVIKCPDCSNLISSHSPECSDCGLKTSELEVIEHAEFDEQSRLALSAAHNLFYYATVVLVFLFLGLIIGAITEPGMAAGQIFVSLVALGSFWWRYVLWGRRHVQNRLPDEIFADAVETRRRTLMIGFALTCIVLIGFYWTITNGDSEQSAVTYCRSTV